MLLYAIGNVGRQDDALAWAFADAVEQSDAHGFSEIIRNYQMNIEDAELFSRHDEVLVVDASMDDTVETFRFSPLVPDGARVAFTTHLLSPKAVTALCKGVYNAVPPVTLLEIRGYEWDLKIGMTPEAQKNLDAALTFYRKNKRAA